MNIISGFPVLQTLRFKAMNIINFPRMFTLTVFTNPVDREYN